MKFFRSFLFFLFLIPFCSHSFHIVGGEMEFIRLDSGKYRIRLIQYRDDAQTINQQVERIIQVHWFRNSDNRKLAVVYLTYQSQSKVSFSNIACAIGQLRISKVVYSADINLAENNLTVRNFDDPQGYYFTWERCCRNERVVNLINPLTTGINYVLEISPLYDAKTGKEFINSSPINHKPLRDYACQNHLLYGDLSAVDPDGDSLVYSLVTPLNSSTRTPVPYPTGKPFKQTTYAQGYSEQVMIDGNPNLTITKNGAFRVRPSTVGLFVFEIKIEEYRKGVKIGEVRRDFQMLVVDGCTPLSAPNLSLNIPSKPNFNTEIDTLYYNLRGDKCFTLKVSNLSKGEVVKLITKGINYNIDERNFFSFSRNNIPITNESLMEVKTCVMNCLPANNQVFVTDIIASDNACPVPQLDTLRLKLAILPYVNTAPVLPSDYTINVPWGSSYQNKIVATDVDGDIIDMKLIVDGVSNPKSFGFDLKMNNTLAGRSEAVFTWDLDCKSYDFSSKSNFKIKIIAEDKDDCGRTKLDTLVIDANVLFTPNNAPVFKKIPSVSMNVGKKISLNIMATDADQEDKLSLRLLKLGGSPTDGVSFMQAQQTGGAVASQFIYEPLCELFKDNEPSIEVKYKLVVEDGKCSTSNSDTLDINIVVKNPVRSHERFKPPNMFSPNGDGINETFKLSENVNQSFNLPEDNCSNKFENILILNRAGVRVFSSNERNFEWDGDSYPAGIYYYHVNYTTKKYKGTISMLK